MHEQTAQPQLGLAIAALVLGILSFLLSWMLVGALLGLVGLIFGLIHMGRPAQPRGMAVSGLILSSLGILASIGFGVLYFTVFTTMMDRVSGPALQVWEGVEAPDFTVTTLEGETLTLSELEGKRVIIDFWATWCQPCVREVPHFKQLREEVSDDDLVLVGISSESPDVIRPFLEEHEITYPSVSTNDLPLPYAQVSTIPTKFFIDRNGVIQSVVVGYRDFEVLRGNALADDYVGEVLTEPAPPVEGLEDDHLHFEPEAAEILPIAEVLR